MKIKRFNEALTGRWRPGDKIIKGTLHMDFEIDKDDLNLGDYDDDIEMALNVYLQDSISNRMYEYKLVDYQDNEITDEELYDSTNKYNL